MAAPFPLPSASVPAPALASSAIAQAGRQPTSIPLYVFPPASILIFFLPRGARQRTNRRLLPPSSKQEAVTVLPLSALSGFTFRCKNQDLGLMEVKELGVVAKAPIILKQPFLKEENSHME
uniref:Uncharacterized protein n=1 Tax=Leersia perrieri TaxID=77586 RepID=A0A0D9XCP1_9ORYZ